MLTTVGIGFVNFVMTIFSMWLIDRLGRRILLYIGFIGTALSLALIALTLHQPHLHWVSVVSFMVYIAAFAISLGPVPFVVMSEIFPLDLRGLGMSLAGICNWGFNSLVVFLFPIMTTWLGNTLTFGLYSIICLFGIWFTYQWMPETKGISLEHIEEYLLSGKPLRALK